MTNKQTKSSFNEVIEALKSERAYQEKRWPKHKHTAPEYILIMEKCLADAKACWIYSKDSSQTLHEIRQVVSVGVAAMEQHGAYKRIQEEEEE